MPALAVALSLMGTLSAGPMPICAGLVMPLAGEIVAPFAPIGRYEGHWGIDIAAPVGAAVHAAGPGVVTFAGSVAGRLSVTVDHGGGLRTSYSYLQWTTVGRGVRVRPGTVIGVSGDAHGAPAVHFSVRVNGRYQDPANWLRCLRRPAVALRLSPTRALYHRRRASRHPRRNLRSSPPCPPRGRRDGVPRAGTRRSDLHSHWCAVAEGRSRGDPCGASVGDGASGDRRRRLLRGRRP